MSQLSSFAPEDVDLIVSLPYRVGINVSHAEDEEGEQDDELEMRALEACIREVGKIHEDSPFLIEISKEIMNRKDMWPQWSQGTFNIAPDCEKVVEVLKPVVSEKELKDYKRMILEVATSVAEAYGEFGDAQEEKGFFGALMSKVVSGFANDDNNHPMNVSAAEDTAISKIKAALTKAD